MSQCVLVQIRCKPGTAYKVASDIADREIHSSLFSTSGEFDLFLIMYVDKDIDIGRYINDNLLDIEDIERTITTLTFKAF